MTRTDESTGASSSGNPTAKRPRLSASEPTSLQHPQYYFKDGSIALSAHEDPDDEDSILLIFRVHASILARESTVFADMIDLPTPSDNSQDMYDGVPLIHLHDKAEHVKGFLRAIYEPLMIRNLFLDEYTSKAIDAIAGPLILAYKYEALAIKERILKRVHEDWPSNNYKKWCRRDHIVRNCGYDITPEKLIHLSHITNARTELAVPLSMAYYALSSYVEHTYENSLLKLEDILYAMAGRRKMRTWIQSAVMGGMNQHSLQTCAECDMNRYTTSMIAHIALYDLPTSLSEWQSLSSSPHLNLLDAYSMIPEFFSISTWDKDGLDAKVEFEPYDEQT
ncbi:hypothetical protein ONZ45_g6359 [Pleurotus djamor]|nr:hypothetical protein ONZ45_g6359 [Pleurotus djamor]